MTKLPKNTEPFKTHEEVAAYLSGDTITCLICGEQFKHLSGHVRRTHKISASDYRKMYDIPQGMPLVVKSISTYRSKHALQQDTAKHLRAYLSANGNTVQRRPNIPKQLTRAQRLKKRGQAVALLRKRKGTYELIPESVVNEYERLVQEEHMLRSAAARHLGYHEQSLAYARRRIARDKGLPDPAPLVSYTKRPLQVQDITYTEMTEECADAINALVSKYKVSFTNAAFALGAEDHKQVKSWDHKHRRIMRRRKK